MEYKGMKIKILKMKLFRLCICGLCKLFGYGGIIYNVTWRVHFGDLIESDRKVIAMNNTIKAHNLKANLRPLGKNEKIIEQQ